MTKIALTPNADSLFFKYQHVEATKAEWLAIIAEIKLRFPYSKV